MPRPVVYNDPAMADPEFQNRVVIVTGASSGIGLRVAERFRDEGARVVAFARATEKLSELVASARDRVLAVAGSVASPDDVEKLFDETEKRFGPCEVLVNSAGAVTIRTLNRLTVEEWDETFDVNVRGIFLTSRRALLGMFERRSGTIINVASISGIVGTTKFPGTVSYAASKAAVIAFTEALAVEVKGRGIRVNAVSPGSVDTPMLKRANPMAKPDMTPDEVAEVILFLASGRSRPVNGQNLHVFSA